MKKKDSSLRNGIMMLIITGIVFSLISLSTVWCSLDVSTSIGGVADADLKVDFSEPGVNYRVDVIPNASGGFGGGIIGDTGNITIEEEKMYLSGMGDFQENIGLVMDSYDKKEYQISANIEDTDKGQYEKTTIDVTTTVDMIPWWPVGTPQKVHVAVSLNNTGNIQKVIINKVRIEIWRNWDEDDNDDTQSKTVWEKSLNKVLVEYADIAYFDADVTLDGDY